MSFFSVFDLDCRTDVILVGRRGVREVEAVLAHALVHAASEAQPAAGVVYSVRNIWCLCVQIVLQSDNININK